MLVTQENASAVLREISADLKVSIDTETTGLEERDVPFAAIVATKDKEFYFDERAMPSAWDAMKDVARNNQLKVFQNAKFDITMLGRKGVLVLENSTDIAIMSRIERNDHFGAKAYSLDAQAKRELGVPKDNRVAKYIKEHNLYEVRRNFFGEDYKVPRYDWVPMELMQEYACLDARLTYDLHTKYCSRLPDRAQGVLAVENALVHVCQGMERRGLLLNKQYTLAALYYERELMEAQKQVFIELTGVPFVDSAKSIQKLISYELPKTEDGNPSLKDEVVDMVLESDADDKTKKIVETVRSIRGFAKRISTYYEGYLNVADANDIVHPWMWQAGTRTGRFSYSDPNLQNIPKEEKSEEPYVVRGCFKPRPGRVYVSMDYSQMEYRMMAAYANEAGIIQAVLGGADFHQATADLLGIPRSYAKTVNFAILYGAGDDKIGSMLGITKSDARRLRYKYFMALPRVEHLIDKIISTGKTRGYVTNWAGRDLYADKNFCYALPNHLIQGGGADVVKKAMQLIASEFPDLWMVLQIHDQLVFEMTPEEYKYIPRIKEIMESVFPAMNGMTLTVDVSWSATSLAERDMTKGLPC